MKNKFIFLTRSVRPIDLTSFAYSTSSQAYEVALILSLSKRVDLCVVYIGTNRHLNQCDVPRLTAINLNNESLEYLYFGPVSFVRVPAFIGFLNEHVKPLSTSIITSGYFPFEMVVMLVMKHFFRAKTFSIVFDTHVTNISGMRFLLKRLATLYFELGFFLMRFLSGIIVLNDSFVHAKRLGVRYHKTKVGALFNSKDSTNIYNNNSKNDILTVLFAGTLNSDNGVGLVLDFLTKYPGLKIRISFYGGGDYVDRIKSAVSKDERIKYFGIIQDNMLDKVLVTHDLLLCLRDPDSIVCQYAFPSKLIKFMGSGVPVICNKFPGLGLEYQDHLMILKEYSVDGLAAIFQSDGIGDREKKLGVSAKEFIVDNHNWKDISDKLINFTFEV